MRKRKYVHLLQGLCLELNRLLELLPSVFSFSTSACSMCWFLCPHHVVSREGAIYPRHTELQIEHPSLITDAQVVMLLLFSRCLAVFSLLSGYVVVCGYCTRDQPDFNLSRVHTCYLSFIHLQRKWLVGHVYRMIFHVGSEKKEKPWKYVALLDTDVKRNFRFERFCWFVSLRCMWACLVPTCFSPAHPMSPEESPTSKRSGQIAREQLCPYGTGIDVWGGCPAHACKSRQVC